MMEPNLTCPMCSRKGCDCDLPCPVRPPGEDRILLTLAGILLVAAPISMMVTGGNGVIALMLLFAGLGCGVLDFIAS